MHNKQIFELKSYSQKIPAGTHFGYKVLTKQDAVSVKRFLHSVLPNLLKSLFYF